jgi:DNA mismatch endonuclease, patch repair protein
MTTPERSRLMSRIRGKNTGPELSVRRLAHAWGFRFRLHRRELPGCPDLVFPRFRKAILVHGCFWHHHDDPACRNAVLPKTRPEWWRAKLLANVERDARNLRDLQSLGWDVLVLWECEIRSHRFMPKLASFLGAPLPVPEPALYPSGQGLPSSAERLGI